jgi:hypothetical protein
LLLCVQIPLNTTTSSCLWIQAIKQYQLSYTTWESLLEANWIITFFLTALSSDRPINLIRVCHLLSIGPANCCKWNLFTCNSCGQSLSTWSLQSRSKGLLTEPSKLRIRLSRTCSSPRHSMVDFHVMLVAQESLIWSL